MENGYCRAQIGPFTSEKEVTEFVQLLNTTMPIDRFVVEDEEGFYKVNPRSVLGLWYGTAEFKKMFLVNLTNDGKFPAGLDKFRSNYNAALPH